MSVAGQYRLDPGKPDSIQGSRPVVGGGLLGRLLRGKDEATATATLGSLLTLCGHAQRHVSHLTMQAARLHAPVQATPEASRQLAVATARDHQLNQKLQARHLQSLEHWRGIAQALRPATRCLEVLDTDEARQTAQLAKIAQSLRDHSDFAQYPLWQGLPAETGAWTRLRHRSPSTKQPITSLTVWERFAAREAELIELTTSPLPHTLLASGAVPLGAGEAIGWCEMARGLLLHWVQLDAQDRVLDYRVLPPTEWNFHPRGALAQTLAQLDPRDAASAWCLACAYDPCVECSVNISESSDA